MKIGILREVLMDLAVACSLLTRLPMPALPDAAFDRSARAVWCYPLVGLLVALPAAIVFWLGSLAGLPAVVCAGLVLAVLAMLTGAMHEDGLGDCADGFWGGHDPARRLEIMKDSQIGSYGTLALMLVTGMRWSCYAALLPAGLSAIFVAAALSRAVMPVVMYIRPHARSSGLSHGVGRPARGPVLAGLGLAVLAGLALSGPVGIVAMITALIAAAVVASVAQRKIGGQTGDVLGATQQIAEVTALCTLLSGLT